MDKLIKIIQQMNQIGSSIPSEVEEVRDHEFDILLHESEFRDDITEEMINQRLDEEGITEIRIDEISYGPEIEDGWMILCRWEIDRN